MRAGSSRIGLVMFLLYLLLYGGFVVQSAFFPKTMETTPVAGLNLAVLYGFGLILTAFVLALAYGLIRRGTEDQR